MQDPTTTPSEGLDLSRAHQARAVNYLLGGKDNYQVDREETDASKTDAQLLRRMAWAHVQFRQRAVAHMAAAGVRQFLNFDGGFPHALELHEIAQRTDPTAHVVYVATDPVVAAHSRALLTGDPRGQVRFVPGEAAAMADLLADPELTATLDLDQPLGVTLSSSLMTLSDTGARAQLDVLRAAAAPGSRLALSQMTADFDPDALAPVAEEVGGHGITHPVRTRAELAALFEGWQLLEPGVTSILEWWPPVRAADGSGDELTDEVHILGGVARRR